MKYPRPMSEPPSPTSSRASTPAPSEHGSDDEEDHSSEEHESWKIHALNTWNAANI